jgi:hypothetical protein
MSPALAQPQQKRANFGTGKICLEAEGDRYACILPGNLAHRKIAYQSKLGSFLLENMPYTVGLFIFLEIASST